MMMSMVPATQMPLREIHVQAPVGIPTGDGGMEIPNRIFLGGIPLETTEMELELFFSDFGSVKDVRIVSDRITGKCKGYGFVTFDEDVDISSFFRRKTIVMNGDKLRIRKAIRRKGSSQFKKENSASETPIAPTKLSTPIQMTHAQQQGPFYMVPGIPSQHNGGYTFNMSGLQQQLPPVSIATSNTCQTCPNNVYPVPYYPCHQMPAYWPVVQY